MAILVRQYGLLFPLDWDHDCQEHLWLENKLWNQLVEIEHNHQEKFKAITGADIAVGAKETILADMLLRKGEASKRKKLHRSEARSKKIDTSLLDRTIKDLTVQIKELRLDLKSLRKISQDKNKEALEALETARKESVKHARNSSGLWWGNYNAVVATYNIARVRGMKEGRELKFHRFDGTGRFTCQLQGGIGLTALFAGQATVAVDPVDHQAFFHPSRGERRRLQRTILRFTIYTYHDETGHRKRRTLSFPMIMHRPIPDDATIKTVTVKRDRVGTEYRWAVTFTCVTEDKEKIHHPGESICGIDIGWRTLGGVGVRVATIASNTDKIEEIVLPSSLISKFDHVDNIKSRLDKHLNNTHLWLKTLIADDLPEDLREEWGKIKKAPKIGAGRVAMLSLRWRNEHDDFNPHHLEKLEAWRKKDKFYRLEMDNLRENAIAQRTDIYRNTASRIAHQYALIGLEDFDLSQIARLETIEGEDNTLSQGARRLRHRVAISDFRNWLTIQTEKTGSVIFRVRGKTSLIHHRCGQELKPIDKSSIRWKCQHCNEFVDQDENAARNIQLVAAGTPVSDQVRLITA